MRSMSPKSIETINTNTEDGKVRPTRNTEFEEPRMYYNTGANPPRRAGRGSRKRKHQRNTTQVDQRNDNLQYF